MEKHEANVEDLSESICQKFDFSRGRWRRLNFNEFRCCKSEISPPKWRNINLLLAAWFHLADCYREKCCYRSDQKRAHLTLAEFPIMFWLRFDCILATIEKLFLSNALINFSSSVSLIETMETGINTNWKSIEFIRQIETAKSDRTKAPAKDKTEANENAENGEIICVLSRS